MTKQKEEHFEKVTEWDELYIRDIFWLSGTLFGIWIEFCLYKFGIGGIGVVISFSIALVFLIIYLTWIGHETYWRKVR